MKAFNQNNQGNIMPLLMNFTTPTPIQYVSDMPIGDYNNVLQISYEMKTVHTRCQKALTFNLNRNAHDNKEVTDDCKVIR